MRAARVRAKIAARSTLVRLSVFRSGKYIYAQAIDDTKGKTLASFFGHDAKMVGEEIAKRTMAAGVKMVVLDRGAYQYQGRVKALAEAAKEKGLKL